MQYTEQDISDIIEQVKRIQVRGQQVFLAFPDEATHHVHHAIFIDSGPTIAKLEFEKAPEDAAMRYLDESNRNR